MIMYHVRIGKSSDSLRLGWKAAVGGAKETTPGANRGRPPLGCGPAYEPDQTSVRL